MNNLVIFLLLTTIKTAHNANILAILPTPVHSHKNVLGALLQVLSTEHKITYYGPPLKKYTSSNITEKEIVIYNYLENVSERVFEHVCRRRPTDILINGVLWTNVSFYQDMFEGNDIQDLLKSNQHFDLLITIGHSSEQVFPFAHKFDIPIVQVSPSIICPWSNEAIGNPIFYASDISFFGAEISGSIIDRLKRYIDHFVVMTHYHWNYIPFSNRITQRYFSSDTPNIKDIAKDRTKLVFTNTISHMGYSRANVPAVVEIGGMHCHPARALPDNLEEFIESSGDDGFIYFSLGSTIQGSLLPENIRKQILKVFSKLPQKILWKWEGEMNDLPSNVRISKWIPQQDVLGHKKLKLFITQGGMLSIQESAYHGVPLLIIPLILDQYTNAKVVERTGYGEVINICNFNEYVFEEKLLKVLNNPEYNLIAKELSSAIRDTDFSPQQKAKWWINYIIKHKHTSLRPNNTNYSEVDIFLVFLLTVITFIFILFLGLKYSRPYVIEFYYYIKKKYEFLDKVKIN